MTDHDEVMAALNEVKAMVRHHIDQQFHVSTATFGQVVDTQARIVAVLDGEPQVRLDGSAAEPTGGLRADVAELKERSGMSPIRIRPRTQLAIGGVVAVIVYTLDLLTGVLR